MPPSEWMDPQNIIAISSIIIAVLAFIVSLIALWGQRKHDSLSVKPIGIIKIFDSKEEVRIEICNHGSGPMIIKSIKTSNLNNKKEIREKFKNYPFYWLNDVDRKGVYHWEELEGASLINGPNPIILLCYKLDPEGSPLRNEQEKQRDRIRETLKKLTISLTYSDIYGKVQPECIKQLDYFGREIKS